MSNKEHNHEILTFKDRQAFREWLGNNGTTSGGVWLIFSKSKTLKTLTATEALEEALCHGWIDGQMQSIDDTCYKKYFAKRLPRSKWSLKNKQLVQQLVKKGLVTDQGLSAIETAKNNGSWDNAESLQINDEQIELFKEIIRPYQPAYSNFLTMSHSAQRTYTGFYLDAKTTPTRQSRLEKIIERLNLNLKAM